MSKCVCNLEEQTHPIAEVELADEQLGAIFGAHDCGCKSKSHPQSKSAAPELPPPTTCTHVGVSKTFHERFKFSLEICLDIEEDEEADEICKDWDK